MSVHKNLKVQHKCSGCATARGGFFCGLPPGSLQNLDALKISNFYPRGSVLFIEGETAQGVYILCQGKVKLSTCSRDGKVIILQIAEAGEVLGLSAVVSGAVYEVTAEVIEPCQISFVRKSDFLRLLQQNTDVCLNAVRQLSQNYQTAHGQICSLGLSTSVADKLAKLFLGWCANSNGSGIPGYDGSVHLKIHYTHEEIAEMIGTSRETVSRLLKNFRERKLISLKGADLVIHDRRRLESVAGI
jgi:CRP/FNR family transcriptional regulator, cyclic AMP receptor protein